jgi:hypothetical protein
MPPYQEVKFGKADLLAGAAGGARSCMSSRGARRPTIWRGWGHRAGRDIGPSMGSGTWVNRLGRLRCQELWAVA